MIRHSDRWSIAACWFKAAHRGCPLDTSNEFSMGVKQLIGWLIACRLLQCKEFVPDHHVNKGGPSTSISNESICDLSAAMQIQVKYNSIHACHYCNSEAK